MIKIREATLDDITLIQNLARQVWPPTFADILSGQQIEYMIDMMYSLQSLQKQLTEGCHYLLAYTDNEYLGYLSYELNVLDSTSTKLHKIYVLPSAQGKGVGRFMIEKARLIAKEFENTELVLNVNRSNKAKLFYEKLGFTVSDEENIDIGNGFLMEDYVMSRSI